MLGSLSASPGSAQVLTSARRSQYGPSVVPIPISLRGGAMLAPRTAGLVGLDLALPGVMVGGGWEGRLDADVIIKANFAEVNTVVPVTLSLMHYAPVASGRALYYGFGAGALLGGKAKVIGKGILGMEVTPRIAIEGNVIVTDDKPMINLLARLHL